MYGLLIESLLSSIRESYGPEAADDIQRKVCRETTFSLRGTYSEELIPNIASLAGRLCRLAQLYINVAGRTTKVINQMRARNIDNILRKK